MSVIFNLLTAFWAILKFFLIPLGVLLAFFGLLFGAWLVFYLVRGYRPQKGQSRPVKRPCLFRAVFVDAPRRFWADWFSRDPDAFRPQGCIVFTGRQGYGKTIALVEQTMQWQKAYPLVKCISNLGYTRQDTALTNWRQLIDYKNGVHGVIVQMDEMQNWFSSNQSKDFPPEMLEVITQNRKNRRVILGTSQCFNRLAKPLREQATEVRRCFTLLGCITIVQRVEPELDSTGDVVKWKHRGFYYFVHSQELRDSYDTYKVIESLRKSGFQPQAVQAASDVRLQVAVSAAKHR